MKNKIYLTALILMGLAILLLGAAFFGGSFKSGPPAADVSPAVTGGEPDLCNQLGEAGPCEGLIPGYYFDPEDLRCRRFNWGGCGGNRPFETMKDCQAMCGNEEGWYADNYERANDCKLSQNEDCPDGALCKANPAAVFCECMGGTRESVDSDNGTRSICKFAEESFEEWEYYRKMTAH